jgi:hypothetical protein
LASSERPCDQQLRVLAQQRAPRLVQVLVVEQRRRWRAAAHIQKHLGLAAALQQQRNMFVDAHKVRLRAGLHRLAQVGSLVRSARHWPRPGIAHKVAHARPGFQMALSPDGAAAAGPWTG